MMTIALGIGAYCLACYVLIGYSIWKSPGPGGFGVLLIPFAPLMPPLGVWLLFKRYVLGIR